MAIIRRTENRSLKAKNRNENKSNIILPAEKSIPESDMLRYTFLIAGERKIGKTSLCANFPDTFFIMCEPGGKGLSLRKVDVNTWEDIKKVVFLLCEKPGYCKTVVIDTGYMAYELCFDYCLRTMGLDKPQDEAWGNAWKFIEREFRSLHTDLVNAGFGICITAHTEIKDIKLKGGGSYSKMTTQLGGQASRFYNGFVDILCHYQYNSDGKRELILRGDDFVDAGCRAEEAFFYTNGEPIFKLPIDFSGISKPAKKAFDFFENAFYSKLQKEGGPQKIKRTRR